MVIENHMEPFLQQSADGIQPKSDEQDPRRRRDSALSGFNQCIEPIVMENNELPNDADLGTSSSAAVSVCRKFENKDNGRTKNRSNQVFSFLERFAGILYTIISALLFALSHFGIKQLKINMVDALILRFLLQSLVAYIYNVFRGYPLFKGAKNQHLLCFVAAFFATTNNLFFYLGLSIVVLPDATTVRYTAIVWTAIISIVAFHEKVSLITIFSVLLTFTGIVLVAQPTFLFSKLSNITMNPITSDHISSNGTRYIGLFLVFLGALSISFSVISTKKLYDKYNVKPMVFMFHFSILTGITFLVTRLVMRLRQPEISLVDELQQYVTFKFLLASFIGVLQIIPAILYQEAIRLEHPSIVTVAQSSELLFAILLQNIFTDLKSNWLAITGSMLVLMSIFLLGGQKFYRDRQQRRSPNK